MFFLTRGRSFDVYMYKSEHHNKREIYFYTKIHICFYTFEISFSFLSQVAVRGHVVLMLLFSSQAAQSVNKALEQFVKPEQLDGENSYKCSKYEDVTTVLGWDGGSRGVEST